MRWVLVKSLGRRAGSQEFTLTPLSKNLSPQAKFRALRGILPHLRDFRRSPKIQPKFMLSDTAICRMYRRGDSMMPNEPTARLEARLPAEVHAVLKRAAQIQGRTVTDFVVAAAHDAARRTIEETEIIRLSAEDQRRFAAALLDPPEPNAALRRAAEAHRRLLGPE